MNHRCCATTKKGKPCPIQADRLTDGKPYCHIHDPLGTFQQQVAVGLFKRPRSDEPCTYCGQPCRGVVPCCRKCHSAKGKMSDEEFKAHISAIAKHLGL